MGEGSRGIFIGGVKVQFPAKPYPSQIAMMAQIMKGLNKGQNCLLESPTGTGKSLALLCSTLAWHAAEEDRVQRYNSLLDQGVTDPDILGQIFRSAPASSRPNIPSEGQPQPQPQPQPRPNHTQPPQSTALTQDATSDESQAAGTQAEGGFVRGPPPGDDADLQDFKDSFRFRIPEDSEDTTLNISLDMDETLDSALPAINVNHLRRKRTPKIFFGTRTHKQIFQIMRELRKTQYSKIRSVVLGSREHTCIHPIVSRSKNKNEGCKTLLENKEDDRCSFYHGVNRMKQHEQLPGLGVPPAWDLEDLVKGGRKARACPYFASRHLMETAQIVFCPYNYLIDPLIRESMSIDLRHAVLVLDEAHNVEDSSREAASFVLTQDQIIEALNDLERLVAIEEKPESCRPLIQIMSSLSQWMDSNKENLTDHTEYGKTVKIISGRDMIDHLKHMDVEPSLMSKYEGCLIKLNEESDPDNPAPKPAATTSQLLSGFFLVLKYFFKGDFKYVNDYKVALVRAQVFGARASKKDSGGWIGRKSGPSANYVYSLNFWCLNPGVSFSDLGVMTRCIILTSGTLSPMNSFESELQAAFSIKLEANHVIAQDQVWVGTIAKGPTDQTLNSTYKHSETWAFQDELGRLLLGVCEAIPRGVLCFLPSYAMLDKLVDRWQSSSLMDQIEETKVVIMEPRKAEDFEASMKLFYNTIADTRNWKEGEVNGALFIAVCRGKVSEGLDFTDDYARAVIAVGIPFPNFKDIQVSLKRSYNDLNTKQKGLLSGSEWYEIQAFRALNQALGRCIRHRMDWGAILLVDERYQWQNFGQSSNRYVKGLSKWVRNSLRHEKSFGASITQLKQFAKRMTEKDELSRSEIAEEKQMQDASSSKPRFLTPPIFQRGVDKGERDKPSLRSEMSAVGLDSSHVAIDLSGIARPQNAILLTPIKDSQGVPLTPIAKDERGRTPPPPHHPNSPTIIFPFSSTQNLNVTHPTDPNHKVIGFINRTNVRRAPSLSSKTPIRKGSASQTLFPIFHSASKKRKQPSDASNKSPDGNSANNGNSSCAKDDSSCAKAADELSYLSDDLFNEDEVHAASSNLQQKCTIADKVEDQQPQKSQLRRAKKSNRKSAPNVDTSLNSSNSTFFTSFDGNESDMDDFNLNTSTSSKASRKSKGGLSKKRKPKGVVFSDWE